MSNEMLWCAYDSWVESDKYKQQSALENGGYGEQKEKIIRKIGEESYDDIADCFLDTAAEAERAGFEYGFRSAFKFISSMLSENEEKVRAVS